MIQLTESAIGRVRQVMQQKPEVRGLRLGVQGGGCSGLSYLIQFDSDQQPEDQVYEFGGARVLVDPQSLTYLNELRVDYKSDLMQQGFVLENPNAAHTCGCGTSFSPKD